MSPTSSRNPDSPLPANVITLAEIKNSRLNISPLILERAMVKRTSKRTFAGGPQKF